jgi:hypothetical protein
MQREVRMKVPIRELASAPTLKDLLERVREAIEIAGPDAPWKGNADECIYIPHTAAVRARIRIAPGSPDEA